MDKEDVVHTQTHTHTVEYYSAIKNKILPFATIWIDLEGIMLSEISQTNTIFVLYHLYVVSKFFKMNLTNITKKKLTHRYKE